MSWQDLETLHRNIPYLEVLELKSIYFIKDDVLPLNLNNLETTMRIYMPKYIQAKYPKLECLNLRIDRAVELDDLIQLNHVDFQSLFQHYGPQLKSVEVLDLEANVDAVKRLDDYGYKVNTLQLESKV